METGWSKSPESSTQRCSLNDYPTGTAPLWEREGKPCQQARCNCWLLREPCILIQKSSCWMKLPPTYTQRRNDSFKRGSHGYSREERLSSWPIDSPPLSMRTESLCSTEERFERSEGMRI